MARIVEISGRGRALVSERPVQAGEIVLLEQPSLLLVDEAYVSNTCATCLKAVAPGEGQHCHCHTVFCTRLCRNRAEQSAFWHPQHVCLALQRLDRCGLTSEDATSLRLLVHLKAAKAAALQSEQTGGQEDGVAEAKALLDVVSGLSHASKPHPLARELHRRLAVATGDAGLSEEDVDVLLRKESSNSYGIMAASGLQGTRNIRGSGIYAHASLLNHDCLPNLARFDEFESAVSPGQPGSTRIFFRALHDLPAGEELTVSYFPLTCTYQERQQRCRDLYGFECRCPRCQEESTWSDDDEEGDEMERTDESASSHGGMETEQGGEVDSSYISVFLLKYVCPQEHCLGTMAPLQGTDQYICNMCGVLRTEADFMREMDEY